MWKGKKNENKPNAKLSAKCDLVDQTRRQTQKRHGSSNGLLIAADEHILTNVNLHDVCSSARGYFCVIV